MISLKLDPILRDYLSFPSEQEFRKGNAQEHEEKIRKGCDGKVPLIAYK